jgi:hypothetical protein
LYGLDPSPACAEAARRLHGVKAEAHGVEALVAAGETFGFVVVLAVLEHVREVSMMLEGIKCLLIPDGLLYAEVPDAGRFALHPGAPFQQLNTEHINFFSRPSLSNLMASVGFAEHTVELDAHEEAPGVTAPSLEALYRRVDTTVEIVRDEVSEPALTSYVTTSQAAEEQVMPVLLELAAAGRPVVVWGAGTLTQHLLGCGRFEGVNVVAFVDTNPHLQGRRLAGRPILAPGALAAHPGTTILVCSRNFQHEIADTIRRTLRLDHPIATLFPTHE